LQCFFMKRGSFCDSDALWSVSYTVKGPYKTTPVMAGTGHEVGNHKENAVNERRTVPVRLPFGGLTPSKEVC
jgi:hypothetical protein